MERTSQKCLDGVRAYKHSSEKQREVLSSILNNAVPPTKKVKLDQPEPNEELKEVVGAHPVQDTPCLLWMYNIAILIQDSSC